MSSLLQDINFTIIPINMNFIYIQCLERYELIKFRDIIIYLYIIILISINNIKIIIKTMISLIIVIIMNVLRLTGYCYKINNKYYQYLQLKIPSISICLIIRIIIFLIRIINDCIPVLLIIILMISKISIQKNILIIFLILIIVIFIIRNMIIIQNM